MDTEIYLTDGELAAIFAMGYFPLLQETEGVIVHYKGRGFVVVHENKQVKIKHDDDVLKLKDRSLVWVHNEQIGNA